MSVVDSSKGARHTQMEGFDSPRPRGSFLNETVELARRYYDLPGNGTGGALHVVLDEGNLEPSLIAWCRDRAQGHARDWGSSDPELAIKIANRMLRMSKTQRRKMVARLAAG